jgi:hypothetical protein
MFFRFPKKKKKQESKKVVSLALGPNRKKHVFGSVG